MKILILKPSSLGDVIQALPVLRLLKLWRPDAQIHWWLEKGLIPLLEGDPDLTRAIPFDRKRWASPRNWDGLWASVSGMRRRRYHWVIDLQSLARSGAFAWMANGGLLVGLDDPREGARGFYDVIVRRPSFHTHAVDWYLGTLRALEVPISTPFTWIPPRPRVAAEVQKKWAPGPGPWILVVPGARWENKRWPADRFAAVVRELAAEDPRRRFAILGSADDAELGRQVAMAAPDHCLDLTGKTTLLEMVEWVRLGAAMISNDTGPMHIAAAMRKPVIGIFGPTEPRRTGPYGQLGRCFQVNLECTPCMKGECANFRPLECLRAVTPEVAAERVRQVLALPPASPEWRLS